MPPFGASSMVKPGWEFLLLRHFRCQAGTQWLDWHRVEIGRCASIDVTGMVRGGSPEHRRLRGAGRTCSA